MDFTTGLAGSPGPSFSFQVAPFSLVGLLDFLHGFYGSKTLQGKGLVSQGLNCHRTTSTEFHGSKQATKLGWVAVESK